MFLQCLQGFENMYYIVIDVIWKSMQNVNHFVPTVFLDNVILYFKGSVFLKKSLFMFTTMYAVLHGTYNN